MHRYRPEATRTHDIIGVKLNSGVEITFRPVSGGITIGTTLNNEPIGEPSTFPNADLRRILQVLDLQCSIAEVGAEVPDAIVLLELDDGVTIAFDRSGSRIYASVHSGGERVGYPTFLPTERMRRIVNTLAGIVGPPEPEEEPEAEDEPGNERKPTRLMN